MKTIDAVLIEALPLIGNPDEFDIEYRISNECAFLCIIAKNTKGHKNNRRIYYDRQPNNSWVQSLS